MIGSWIAFYWFCPDGHMRAESFCPLASHGNWEEAVIAWDHFGEGNVHRIGNHQEMKERN